MIKRSVIQSSIFWTAWSIVALLLGFVVYNLLVIFVV
jgi:hypothetical protein